MCVTAWGRAEGAKHGDTNPPKNTPLDRANLFPSGLQSHPVRRVCEDAVRREHEQLKELGGQVCAS